jgi:hypothetical protein
MGDDVKTPAVVSKSNPDYTTRKTIMRLEVEQIIGYDYLTSERFLEFQYLFLTSSPNTQGALNLI